MGLSANRNADRSWLSLSEREGGMLLGADVPDQILAVFTETQF